MTPYYHDEQSGICIYHGDCREVLPHVKADLAVTSPPYNLGRQSGDYANMRDGYEEHGDDMPEDEYVRWQSGVLGLLWDSVGPKGAIFYNHKPVIRDGALLMPTRLVPSRAILRQIIVWDRRIGMNWSPSHFCPQHEWVLLLAHPSFRLTSRSHSVAGDVWSLPVEQKVKGHPCPFPVSLPETAIRATSAETVIDPFMGSGTTLVAAKKAGRRAIGIDVSERYCEIAVERLRQRVLFAGETA